MHVAADGHAVEPDGALVHVVARAGHLVSQTPLSNHVGLLPAVHLLRREADGRAGEGAQLAITAVDALQAVFLAYLAVHHADVEGHGNSGPRVQAGASTCVCATPLPQRLGAVDRVLGIVFGRDRPLKPRALLVEAERRHARDFYVWPVHVGEAHDWVVGGVRLQGRHFRCLLREEFWRKEFAVFLPVCFSFGHCEVLSELVHALLFPRKVCFFFCLNFESKLAENAMRISGASDPEWRSVMAGKLTVLAIRRLVTAVAERVQLVEGRTARVVI